MTSYFSPTTMSNLGRRPRVDDATEPMLGGDIRQTSKRLKSKSFMKGSDSTIPGPFKIFTSDVYSNDGVVGVQSKSAGRGLTLTQVPLQAEDLHPTPSCMASDGNAARFNRQEVVIAVRKNSYSARSASRGRSVCSPYTYMSLPSFHEKQQKWTNAQDPDSSEPYMDLLDRSSCGGRKRGDGMPGRLSSQANADPYTREFEHLQTVEKLCYEASYAENPQDMGKCQPDAYITEEEPLLATKLQWARARYTKSLIYKKIIMCVGGYHQLRKEQSTGLQQYTLRLECKETSLVNLWARNATSQGSRRARPTGPEPGQALGLRLLFDNTHFNARDVLNAWLHFQPCVLAENELRASNVLHIGRLKYKMPRTSVPVLTEGFSVDQWTGNVIHPCTSAILTARAKKICGTIQVCLDTC